MRRPAFRALNAGYCLAEATLKRLPHGAALRQGHSGSSFSTQNCLQPGGDLHAVQGDEPESSIIRFVPRHVPERGQGQGFDPVVDRELLRGFDQFSSDAMPLLVPMDRYLQNMQGVGRHLPIQEGGEAGALNLGDEGNAIRDQGAMLLLRLNHIVGDPLQSRRLPEYFAGAALDPWQEGSILFACGPDDDHVRKFNRKAND
jgi:hypothetical protein